MPSFRCFDMAAVRQERGDKRDISDSTEFEPAKTSKIALGSALGTSAALVKSAFLNYFLGLWIFFHEGVKTVPKLVETT